VEVFVITSEDEGRTWSEPRNITRFAKQPTGWTGILTGPGIGIQKRHAPHTGRIVVPCAHGPVGKWHCYSIHSDDNGDTWQMGGEVPDPLGNECQVVELTDGRLMINTRSYRKKGCRATTFSSDGGETWSGMQDEPALPEPICQGSILRYSDPLDGEPSRLLFSNPAHGSKRENGTIRLSLDDGKSWSRSSVLVPGYYGYSCLTRLADGRIGCLYETAGCGEIRFATFPLGWLGRRLQ
jgi:sialidase-1